MSLCWKVTMMKMRRTKRKTEMVGMHVNVYEVCTNWYLFAYSSYSFRPKNNILANSLSIKLTTKWHPVPFCLYEYKYRAIAIRFWVIGLVVCAQERYTLGGLGACSPRKILKFRGYEIASETNFGPIRYFSEAKRQSFTWMPFCPLGHTPMVSAFWSCLLVAAESHTLRRWSLRD